MSRDRRNSYETKVFLELARRSVSGSWAYVLVVAATGLLTDYPTRYPEAYWLTAVAMAVAIAARFWVPRRLPRKFSGEPGLWRFRFRLAILGGPLVWGAFLALTNVLYGEDWVCALLVILTTGIAAGATTAFHPDLKLHRLFQFLLWLPVIVVALLGYGTGPALGFLGVIFVGYLLWQGEEQARHYWRAIRVRERLAEKTDQLEEHNRIKDEFLAVITHDLRNSIQSVILFSHNLKRRSHDPVLLELGGHLRESGNYMKELLDDLHDLARLGMQALKMKAEEVDLVSLVERVLAEQTQPASEGQIELKYQNRESHVNLVGDAVRIRQILANLVSNAIKYNKPGGWVEVRTRLEGEEAVVEVADSGVGIDPEHQARVFDLFSRVGNEPVDGSGLGLAITRQLVELHQGSLELESELDNGSVFRVRLPRNGPSALAS